MMVDCYVAVTGVPKAQRYHATIMVKFAVACRERMALVVSELDEELGTKDLQLRIGLHSGAVRKIQ